MTMAGRGSQQGNTKLVLATRKTAAKLGATMKNKPLHQLGAQTRAIHAGEGVRHGVGAPVGAPICRTSTFTFSSTAEMKRWAEGKSKAYIYTRYGNPTLAV